MAPPIGVLCAQKTELSFDMDKKCFSGFVLVWMSLCVCVERQKVINNNLIYSNLQLFIN